MKEDLRLSRIPQLFVLSQRCTDKLFNEHALQWVSDVVVLLKDYPAPQVQELCHFTLIKLLQRCDDSKRELLSKSIESLFQHIVATAESLTSSTWRLIISTFGSFRNIAFKHIKELENLAKLSITSPNEPLRHSASYVIPRLFLCGPAGEKRSKHAHAWLSSLNRAIKIHSVVFRTLKSLLFQLDCEDTAKPIQSSMTGGTFDLQDVLTGFKSHPPNQQVVLLSDLLDSFLVMFEAYFCEKLLFTAEVPILQISKLFHSYVCFVDHSILVVFMSKADLNFLFNRILKRMLQTLFIFMKQFSAFLTPSAPVFNDLLLQLLNAEFLNDKTACYECVQEYFKILPCNKMAEKMVNVIIEHLQKLYRFIFGADMSSNSNFSSCNIDDNVINELLLNKELSLPYTDSFKEAVSLLRVVSFVLQSHGTTMKIENLTEFYRIIVHCLKSFVVDMRKVSSQLSAVIESMLEVAYHLVKLRRLDFAVDVSLFFHFFEAGCKSTVPGVSDKCKVVLREFPTGSFHPIKNGVTTKPLLLENTSHLLSPMLTIDQPPIATEKIISENNNVFSHEMSVSTESNKRLHSPDRNPDCSPRRKVLCAAKESPFQAEQTPEIVNPFSEIRNSNVIRNNTDIVVLSSEDEDSCASPAAPTAAVSPQPITAARGTPVKLTPTSLTPTHVAKIPSVNVSDDDEGENEDNREYAPSKINLEKEHVDSANLSEDSDYEAMLGTFVNAPADAR